MITLRLPYFGLISLAGVGLFASLFAHAQPGQKSEQSELPRSKIHDTDSIGEPLAKLPAHINAAKGKVTLFVDVERKTDKGVPI